MHAPLVVVGIVLAFGLGRLSIEAGVGPEHLGWLAAGLMLSTFLMRSMPARRLTGIAANPCFIGAAAPRRRWR